MHDGDRHPVGTAPPGPVARPGRPGDRDRASRPGRRRAWAALAWAAGAAALFALFLRISLQGTATSDAANNALQAWDMLHGHLLLHGWIVSDVAFYTFELPLFALVEVFFGLHAVTVHVAMALVYLIVAACAVAIAVTDSRGAARAARAGVVAAVLAAPALVLSDKWIPLGFPDHMGSAVFLLVPCLLIDRWPARWFTAPLLCVILCAGQIGDVTVRYVAVPAVAAVCAYRVLAAWNIRTGDAANLIAAGVSMPLATALRAVMRHFGSYLVVSPHTRIAPFTEWGHNAALAWHSVRMLFGTLADTGSVSAGKTALFGAACLLVAAAGVVGVIWRWRSARRAEQVLLVAIVANIGVYTISTLPTPRDAHDIAAVLPAGAVLGARALVPARIAGRLPALAVTCAAMVAALLPLSLAAAARPPATSPWAGLTAWLEAHGLRHGLGGYWDGSSVTLQSGNQVQVRTVRMERGHIRVDPWETNTGWFDPSRHYANFVIFNLTDNDLGRSAERLFGKPVSTHRIGNWDVFIYDTNVLRLVKPPVMPPVS